MTPKVTPRSTPRLRFNDVCDWIAHARRIFLICDFDGTLCPIASSPDRVEMTGRTRNILERIDRSPKATVAIISGRRLQELREKAGVNTIFGGNHGIELCGPDFNFLHPEAAGFGRSLNRLCSELEAVIRPWPGAWVENKQWTATVHMRAVPVKDWPPLVSSIRAHTAAVEHMFDFRPGRAALEINPRIGWDKGSAVNYLRRKLDLEDALPICLGDDITDESMFAAITNGITVRVGTHTQTHAKFSLPCVEDVIDFLDETARLLATVCDHSAVWRVPRGGQCRGQAVTGRYKLASSH